MSSRFSATTKRWAVIAAAVVATAIAIFAVLSLSNGSAVSPLAEAGERIEGESMRMHMVMSFPVPEQGNERLDFDGEVISAADGSMVAMNGDFVFSGVTVPTEARMIRGEMWADYKSFRHIMPRGKRWVHLVAGDLPTETLTPSEYARFLADADGVDVVDEDAQVNGKPTTHYKGVVDVAEIAGEIGGETEERYEQMFQGASVDVPIEAWVGRDGLPARIKLDVGSGERRDTMTVDVLEYGVPVDIKPPPAERTISEADFNRLPEG